MAAAMAASSAPVAAAARAPPRPAARRARARAAAEVRELPVAAIRRPLARTRANDAAKVKWLMESIAEIGLQEPIDVLEVENEAGEGYLYYGFSGCHRYEAHQRLGLETIRCRVRRATQRTLRAHLR